MKKMMFVKTKAIPLILAATMAMSSMTVFAKSYSFAFGSGTSSDNVKYSGYLARSSAANTVTQQRAAYSTTYYLQNADGVVVTTGIVASGSTTGTFKFTSGHSESDSQYYRLKGVADSYGGRAGYTAQGNFCV